MGNRGGKRPGAGRPKGSVSKASKIDRQNMILKAQNYAGMALETLADIAQTSESENARISAATHILDRAFGKPGTMPDMRTPDEQDTAKDPFEELWKQAMSQQSPDIIAVGKKRPDAEQTPALHDTALINAKPSGS